MDRKGGGHLRDPNASFIIPTGKLVALPGTRAGEPRGSPPAASVPPGRPVLLGSVPFIVSDVLRRTPPAPVGNAAIAAPASSPGTRLRVTPAGRDLVPVAVPT